ncbi:Ribonuclease H-like superfamily protein [Melia azedarach]|uniref:Ribonuclease H-like superfamily protein n=1 Tax=Melia azedarach TaxID=155640 RepID=A0ACC1Z256_MELAZ|nr:Ribonuclease H-like superfamily protein [Melia azedarach]
MPKPSGGLGFWDMSAFNQALVTKQEWRIIQHPDSQIPATVKRFFWRATQNYLPTFGNLETRKLRDSLICPRCKKEPEDTFHCLVSCIYARRVWKQTSFTTLLLQTRIRDLLSLWKYMATLLTRLEFELLVMVCWSIWYSRNTFLYAGDSRDPWRVYIRAEVILEEFKSATVDSYQVRNSGTGPRQIYWTPLQSGWFKANVDAAVREAEEYAGLGVIIKNKEGKVMAAAVSKRLYLVM